MKRVAPSGATYQVPSLWIDVNVTPGATVMTETDFLNALGHGSAPDCTARVVVHTTVDAKQASHRSRRPHHGNRNLGFVTTQRYESACEIIARRAPRARATGPTAKVTVQAFASSRRFVSPPASASRSQAGTTANRTLRPARTRRLPRPLSARLS